MGSGSQISVPQNQPESVTLAVSQTTAYSAQIAQATQMPVQVMTGQPAPVPQQAQPQPAQVQSVPVTQTFQTPQTAQTAPQMGVSMPTAAKTYTLDELASAAMLLMDRGMQVQLQELLAGYGVEALPMLPPEQYGNFATALREMGAQI